jgi:hypothetical protein
MRSLNLSFTYFNPHICTYNPFASQVEKTATKDRNIIITLMDCLEAIRSIDLKTTRFLASYRLDLLE